MNQVDAELVKALVIAIEPAIERANKPVIERLEKLEQELSEFKVETRERFNAIDKELDGLVKYLVELTKSVHSIAGSQAVIEYYYDKYSDAWKYTQDQVDKVGKKVRFIENHLKIAPFQG